MKPLLPTVYLSAWQSPSRSSIVVVRSARPDADVIAAVREEVARLDRDLPVYRMRSMQDVVAASPGVPARRVLTATFMGFALLAVVLGGIGLFGVVAHDVACRRAELALRIALGADPMRILQRNPRAGRVDGGMPVWRWEACCRSGRRARSAAWYSRRDRLDVLSVGVAACCSWSLVPALSFLRRGARRAPTL